MTIFLETKRLIINVPEPSDFEDYYLHQSDPEVMKYIASGARTFEEVKVHLDKVIEHYQKHGFTLGTVTSKENGKFIGQAGLIYLAYQDNQPDIEIGYRLTKENWHKGYALELCSALIKWGFQHLSVNKLVAIIHPKNDASRRVLEKAGMHYIGLGHYHDHEVARYEIDKNSIDTKRIKLISASLAQYPIIQNMTRFYVYDMSECMGFDPDWALSEEGLYTCFDFKKYWHEPNTFPFLVKYDDELVGFVIIDKKGKFPQTDFNMTQFFIIKRFARKGVGTAVAEQCFKQFRGIWEVMVMPRNENAYRFWRRVIKEFTNHHFQEFTKEVSQKGNEARNIFIFDSRELK